jgi:hypothetical protein
MQKYEIIRENLLNIIKTTNTLEYEKALTSLTTEMIIQNSSMLKMCPLMLKYIRRLKKKEIENNKELEYLSIQDHSNIVYKFKNEDSEIKDRCCKNDTCRFAHKETELRVPVCILYLYKSCKYHNSPLGEICECKYLHTDLNNEMVKLPNVVLFTKKYVTPSGEEIFKIFYYTNCVRIYNYKEMETSVLHDLTVEDRDKLYEMLIEEYKTKYNF